MSVKPYTVKVCGNLKPQNSSLLTLAVAIPQANRAPTLVEKCTELGVARIIPLLCDRSVSIPKSEVNFVERWTRVALSAVEQSGAPLPEITPPMTFDSAMAHCSSLILLTPNADTSLQAVLAKRGKQSELCIFIGPEGGFSEREIELSVKNGATLAALGGTILRIETAAIAAAVLYNLGTGFPFARPPHKGSC